MNIRAEDKSYIANTYGRFDIAAVSGSGAVCVDENGKSYIDFGSGIGVNTLGFCDEQWASAVAKQAATLQHTSNLYYSEPMAALAKSLCERTFARKVFFANSGAEANEGMIKAARKYSFDRFGADRHKIIALENSFHGRTVTTLSATGQDAFHKYFHPFTGGFEFVPPNDIAALELAISTGTPPCAVLLELIQGEGGVLPLDAAYVASVASLCRKNELLLLIDEVQTGVGHTGKLLCCEHYGITPDIVSLAKGLGGGLPIGAVLLGEKCEFTLGASDHGSTFGGNPVACAGANVVLKRLDDELLADITKKGEYLTKRLLALPHVVSVEGRGLMLGVTLDGTSSREVAENCVGHGLMILTAKAKLRLLPPLTITLEELDAGLKLLEEVLSL